MHNSNQNKSSPNGEEYYLRQIKSEFKSIYAVMIVYPCYFVIGPLFSEKFNKIIAIIYGFGLTILTGTCILLTLLTVLKLIKLSFGVRKYLHSFFFILVPFIQFLLIGLFVGFIDEMF
tara:strand:+ start:1003 stop:1356 length:354 start_codon:yes stop_codon:yes gene_type:complete